MNVNGNNFNVTNNNLYNYHSVFSKTSRNILDRNITVIPDASNKSADGDIYEKGSETTASSTLEGIKVDTKTSTSKSKYSAKEMLSEIDKYASKGEAYVIWHSGDKHWFQGTKNGEPDGDKKYFDLDELQVVLGKGNKKSVSVRNNAITFDDNSYYKFIGKDGKEHKVLSLGGKLHTGLFENNSYDKEAVDYVNFWNALSKENPSGIHAKFGNEEIRGRLAEAGIENGFFTVSIGGRTVTHYLSQGKNSTAVHNKEQYDDRYNMITNGRFFHHYEAGQKVMIGGKDYVLGEDKTVDIEYGADIFDIQM